MMKKGTVVLAFLCFLFLGQGQILANELCLYYDVLTLETDDKRSGDTDTKETQSRITVALGKDYFYISDASGKTAYDFRKSRIIYVDEPTKTYSDISLFFTSGFRSTEFRNRLSYREALAQSDGGSRNELLSEESLFDLESTFAIEKPGPKEIRITEIRGGDLYTYHWNGKVVAECRFAKQDLRGGQKELFEKYLVYGCRIHPGIRRLVAGKGKVPQYLKYVYRQDGKTFTVEMTLVKSATEPRDTYRVPPDYQKTYGPPGDELTSIITSVREGTNSVTRLEKEDFVRAIDGLVAQGQYFDAVLAALECGLQIGEDLPQKMNEIMAAGGKDDERVAVFFQNVNAREKETAEGAVKKLKSIDRDGLTRAHVIDVVMANSKLVAGDLDGARKLFIAALRANPYLVAVYKSLGDLLNISFSSVSAWQCWDTARFLYPGHRMLKPVDEYEKELAKDFPDFFLREQDKKPRPWWQIIF